MNISNKQHKSNVCLQPPDRLSFERWFLFNITKGREVKRFFAIFTALLFVVDIANADNFGGDNTYYPDEILCAPASEYVKCLKFMQQFYIKIYYDRCNFSPKKSVL